MINFLIFQKMELRKLFLKGKQIENNAKLISSFYITFNYFKMRINE